MNDENVVSLPTEQDPIEVFQAALANMAVIQERYAAIATILAEIILICRDNADDDAEIGLRVKRVLEDYGTEDRAHENR